MTEQDAARIAAHARRVFGSELESSLRFTKKTWWLALSHRRINRSIELSKIEDWPNLRDTWREILTDL